MIRLALAAVAGGLIGWGLAANAGQTARLIAETGAEFAGGIRAIQTYRDHLERMAREDPQAFRAWADRLLAQDSDAGLAP